MFVEWINLYGAELLNTILVAMFGFFGLVAKNLYKQHVDTKTKEEVVKTVVMGVEQMYHATSGEEKLDKAMSAASEILLEKGITITEFELHMMIEAAVGAFNGVFWDSGAKKLDGDVDAANEGDVVEEVE